MADNYLGSCACGKVHFALDAEPLNIFNCHCTIKTCNLSVFFSQFFSPIIFHLTTLIELNLVCFSYPLS